MEVQQQEKESFVASSGDERVLFSFGGFLTTAAAEPAVHGLRRSRSSTYPSMQRSLLLSASPLSSYLDKSIIFYIFFFFFLLRATGRRQTERAKPSHTFKCIFISASISSTSFFPARLKAPLSWQRPQTGQQKQGNPQAGIALDWEGDGFPPGEMATGLEDAEKPGTGKG